MTGRDIAEALAAAQECGAAEARARLEFLLETMAEGVAVGDVALAGFGRLETMRPPARKAPNVPDGEVVVIGFWTRSGPGPRGQ